MELLKLPLKLPLPKFKLREKKWSVALALSGGGARGLAHIGVLRVLEKHIPIDAIIGTSMGALVGGIYAAGKLDEFEKAVRKMPKKDITALFIESPRRTGLIRGEKIKAFLNKFIKGVNIEDLKLRYAAVAADLRTGNEVVIEKGSLYNAIRASIAIPGLFTPVRFGKMLLVDGGIVDPIPTSIAKKFADKVIASDVLTYHNHLVKKAPASLFKVILDSVAIMEQELMKLSQRLEKPDVTITPKVSITSMNYYEGRKAIADGKKAALEALPEIKKLLD